MPFLRPPPVIKLPRRSGRRGKDGMDKDGMGAKEKNGAVSREERGWAKAI
jgi:hypothetical protein